MYKKYIKILGYSLLLATSHLYAATQHIVEKNETLSGIAQHYGVSQTAIIDANGLKTLDLRVNDILTIPEKEEKKVYIVKSGDNLTRIAQQYQIDIEQLAKINNISSQSQLNIGQRLIVPINNNVENNSTKSSSNKSSANKNTSVATKKTSTTAKNNANTARRTTEERYRVQYGDTLSNIAKQYNVSINQLALANNMEINDTLFFGQLLTIPKQGEVYEAAAQTNTSSKSATKVSDSQTYVVKQGDSLMKVAQKYKVNFRELAKLNNLNYYDHLLIGQTLKIPPSESY